MSLFGPKKFGIALGSGSARGLAHVGVLKVLESNGLAPDIVTGTSMGALVGALYAAGRTPAQIEEIALSFDVKSLLSLADMTMKSGALLSGEKVEEFLGEHLPATFAELRMPFGCVSTDLATGERAVHTEGDLVQAVRASTSIPVIFMPVRDGDRVLVDGFLSDPIPVSLARELGAKVVVAVDVCGDGRLQPGAEADNGVGLFKDLRAALRGERPRSRGLSGLEIASASVEVIERHLALLSLSSSDLVISPEVHQFAGYQFLSVESLVERGEAATEALVERIHRRSRR